MELVKRMLKWPKHHSMTPAITALEMPTMRSRLELGFLQRVMKSESGSLSGQALGTSVTGEYATDMMVSFFLLPPPPSLQHACTQRGRGGSSQGG